MRGQIPKLIDGHWRQLREVYAAEGMGEGQLAVLRAMFFTGASAAVTLCVLAEAEGMLKSKLRVLDAECEGYRLELTEIVEGFDRKERTA